MKFRPHSMWLQTFPAEDSGVSDENLANTPRVLAFLHEHQPCTTASIVAATGLVLGSVSAIIGTGVRAKRLRFTLEKVAGLPRKVKVYSEVI